MTSEIAIMNKDAIALASDSAVTYGQKIFDSANKLFTMSKYHPVGIMVYGSAIFMGVPWETTIKIYRNSLGKKKFNTLKEYATNFVKFLDNGNPLFPNSVQEEYLRDSVYAYFKFIKDKITEEVHSKIDERGEITAEVIEKIISEIIKEHYEKWEKASNIPSIPNNFNKGVIDKYGKIIDKSIEEIFENLPLSISHSNQLKKIAGSLFSKFPKDIEKKGISGVVIAGFGEKDTFPSLMSFHIEGITNNRLKYKEHISWKIDFKTTSSIIPFAQSEMVHTFMEGVDPFYRDTEESYLAKIFKEYAVIVVDNVKQYTDKEKNRLKKKLIMMGDDILKEHSKKLEDYRRERYINPIISVVSMLPKDELAAMAESLVNLTSFKRKVTMESETVSGPIDVAVISKGDGFIWIKRKHYFKAEFNPQFFENYYREV